MVIGNTSGTFSITASVTFTGSVRVGNAAQPFTSTLTTSQSVTIIPLMTFFLFFGYDRAVSGQIDPDIFRVTLGTIVLTIFLFVYCAAGYNLFMEASLRRLPNAGVHLRRANFFLTVAIVGITLEPALILYATRLTEVAALAFVLWLVSLVLLLFGLRGFRRSRAAAINKKSRDSNNNCTSFTLMPDY